MTGKRDRPFDDRRAIDEQAMADRATDRVQIIAHERLSALHAEEASATGAPPVVRAAPIAITAEGGRVVVAAGGGVTALTPEAAILISDLLRARAGEARRQEMTTSH